jgi:hypothetical protein
MSGSNLVTTETILAQNAEVIRALGKRIIADVIEIGRRLTESKAVCGHGNWLPWLGREFGWTEITALNFMRVHSLVGKSSKFEDLSLPVSGLYLLPPRARRRKPAPRSSPGPKAAKHCRSPRCVLSSSIGGGVGGKFLPALSFLRLAALSVRFLCFAPRFDRWQGLDAEQGAIALLR